MQQVEVAAGDVRNGGAGSPVLVASTPFDVILGLQLLLQV